MKWENIHTISDYLTEKTKEISELDKHTHFNFFEDMFKWSNERYVHSNFIALLLSQSYKEGDLRNTLYFELFLNLLNVENELIRPEDFPVNLCEVHPNWDNHQEYKDIDILIMCRDTSSAIIIENKTLSKDRITGKKHLPQLLAYGDRLRNEDGIENIYYVYLTPRRLSPSQFDYFKDKNLTTISYDCFIRDWMQSIIDTNSKESGILHDLIGQYLNFININLNDPREAELLRELIINNKEEAKQLNEQHNELFCKEFVHVKWITIYEILQTCTESIRKILKERNCLQENPEFKDISRYIHKVSTNLSEGTKSTFKITFSIKGDKYYLCNDRNKFSVGRCEFKEFRYLNCKTSCNLKDFSNDILSDELWDIIFDNKKIREELQKQITSSMK